MLRPSAALPLFLLTLTACPVDHVILSGDLESSTGDDGTAGMSSTDEPSDTFVGSETGEPDPTTGEPTEPSNCADMTPAEICEAHPWAGGCAGLGSELECADMLEVIAATPACADIGACEYAACADALADAECSARPPECAVLLACLTAEMPAPPNCCEDHGEVAGAPGLCSLTADHKCVGCDYEPVLCMTHGCGSANVEDCCLSDDGETVPCDAIEPAIVVVPDPIIIPACNPPASLCADLESDCTAAGIDADRCLELAQGVCPGSKCLACERLIDECEEVSPGECDAIAKRCGGCNCDAPACVDMMDAPLPTLFASCFAFPLALGCEEPSVGQCFTTLTYEGCAGLTTCEYHDCMRAIDDLASCTDATPVECAEVAACVAAEAAPWA
jgi:hypothetical protein